MFDYLDYKNTFPISLFTINVENINPFSGKYIEYWRDQKRKIIEGNWVEYKGKWKWLPGPIYFYVNFYTIEVADKNSKSKTKNLGRPRLRDVEWIKGYVHATARGFSGFSEDIEYSCHRVLKLEGEEFDLQLSLLPKDVQKSLYNPQTNKLKKYKDSLEYLYEIKDANLGKPLYYNTALNVVDIEARRLGKTFITSAFCKHNFLTDGAMDYDELLEAQKNGKPLTSQTLIGAIDTKYSGGLCAKLLVSMENLPGTTSWAGKVFPSPIYKKFEGTLESGKYIIARREVKVGGQWKKEGSMSLVHHRTFADNPLAANGTGPSFAVLDEIGFHYNLLPTLGQMAECTMADGIKFGTIWMTGTGGDMEGGSTEAVKTVFYDPESYSCLGFDDIFEYTGQKIGLFIPAWMVLDKYRDDKGNINKELAINELLKDRERLAKAKDRAPLEAELQGRPLVPSEAFLLSTGTILPIADIKMQLGMVEASLDANIMGTPGDLVLDTQGKVIFEPDLGVNTTQVQTKFPTKQNSPFQLKGKIIIWEHPSQGEVPHGLYVAGTDPYAQDDSVQSSSVGATYIIKRAMPGYDNHDKIVAEYCGRPGSMKEYNENVRRLLLYYRAIDLYENNFNNLKEYFETKNSLYLLANTPTILKNSNNTSVSRIYGLHMTGDYKRELEGYLRDWLLEEVGEGKCNLHFVYSIPLLKEMMAYNLDGNFDRVIAIMLAICQKLQMHRIIVKKDVENIKKDSFFSKQLFTNKKRSPFYGK